MHSLDVMCIVFFEIPNARSHVTFLNELDKFWLKMHRDGSSMSCKERTMEFSADEYFGTGHYEIYCS